VTEVRFYHNAQDRLKAACAITAKAVRAGHKVLVYAPDASTAEAYDAQLWSQQPASFIPHVAVDSPHAARTPVLIARQLDNLPYDDMLLNLADELPAGFQRFRQLVEIVAGDEAGRAAARQRWRTYKELACPVQAFDLANMKS
jgi:DNA polymerase-3 subunit chi